ncbi:MAG: hypothetical protein JKX67_06725 [Colwellia sp.]|nr:hypothetical protein [Colwellia sp.]
MKNWQGNWTIAVAAGHTVFAIMMFSTDYGMLYNNGIINSLSTDRSAAAVWFLLFGQALFIIGLLIKSFHTQQALNNQRLPLSVSLNLLLLTLVGVTIMPASGFWLMFPPIISLLVKHRKNINQTVAV